LAAIPERGNQIAVECPIRDPIAGINAAHKQMIDKIDKFKTEIDKEMLRISELSKTTIQYYQAKKK